MPQQDACTLLDSDHQKVEELFAEYESAGQDQSRKSRLAETIRRPTKSTGGREDERFERSGGLEYSTNVGEHEYGQNESLISFVKSGTI